MILKLHNLKHLSISSLILYDRNKDLIDEKIKDKKK